MDINLYAAQARIAFFCDHLSHTQSVNHCQGNVDHSFYTQLGPHHQNQKSTFTPPTMYTKPKLNLKLFFQLFFNYLTQFKIVTLFRVENIILNIDLAPTFLDIAGVDPPSHMDGRSFFNLLFRRKRSRVALQWPDTFLIERLV